LGDARPRNGERPAFLVPQDPRDAGHGGQGVRSPPRTGDEAEPRNKRSAHLFATRKGGLARPPQGLEKREAAFL
jgi:hypothetical protein